MTVSVVIPTYRRPDDLRRCLAALAEQVRRPDEVLVVVRSGDDATRAAAAAWNAENRLAAGIVEVDRPGQVHALQAGTERAGGEVVAFLDDDAAPRPDWLATVAGHFASDLRIGGVGGPDRIVEHGRPLTGAAATVGRLTPYGRLIGNHHLGVGAARDVDTLKGVNMAFRRKLVLAVGFDPRLRGEGAQTCNDLALCLALRRGGWRLVYDPLAAVDHYVAPRHDKDQRHRFHPVARSDWVHNETLTVLDHLPAWRRPVYLAWAALVGNRAHFGLAQAARFLPGWLARRPERRPVPRELAAAWRGRWAGWQTHRRSPTPPAAPGPTPELDRHPAADRGLVPVA